MQSSWFQLYERYAQLEHLRRARALRAQELAEHRAWCDRTAEAVMQEIARVAERRAAEFAHVTGSRVTVSYPARNAIQRPDDGTRMTFLGLDLHGARVDVYSHRGAGGLPYFHLALMPTRPHARMMSVAGCFAARTAAGHELRDASDPARESSAEALVLRAFQLLVEATQRAA